ncbi:hypothetical protein [Chromobacterium haemolyticum]|uniref:hypothetical protein n=1 Tax=Chromobacterium haemolyticum TaxID=394935 RepID=UPI0011311CCD|nr:hypothetical protein [Chromobacterium haemolyticum]
MWIAIPVGIKFGVPMSLTIPLACIGALLGIYITSLLGEKAHLTIIKYFSINSKSGNSLAERFYRNYGEIFFAVIGPLAIGATLSSAIAATLGLKRSKIIYYMSTSVILWSIVIWLAYQLFNFTWRPHV